MEIKYFVRTTEYSKVNYDLDYTEIKDTKHEYIGSYIRALEMINDYNSVLLEDDCVLCKNFKEEIEKVISQYPDTIINFFTSPNTYWTTQYSDKFDYNQCTYFPKGITYNFAQLMKVKEAEGGHTSYGYLLRLVLRDLGLPHLIYRPSLVQHKDVICGRTGACLNRNTIYFKDYLDELGMDMLDACDLRNREKLKVLLERDREVWKTERADKFLTNLVKGAYSPRLGKIMRSQYSIY